MNTFYQSALRKHILQDIYKREVFFVDIQGIPHIGQVKQKSSFGLTARWYMVHGVEQAMLAYDPVFSDILKRLQRDFGQSWSDVMMQIGITTPLESQTTSIYKTPSCIEQTKQQRITCQKNVKKWYNFYPTIREQMPEATILLDTQLSAPDRYAQYSDSCKRYINKGKRAELTFCIATREKWNDFYDMRYRTAFDKGFGVLPRDEYTRLADALLLDGSGTLFLAIKDGSVVSGSICLFAEKSMVYLYGATDRQFGDIGGHYWLTDQILQRGYAEGYSTFDLLGVAPVGFPDHHLAGVSRFKYSFGGTLLSYIGSYDMIFNTMLYQGFKLMRA